MRNRANVVKASGVSALRGAGKGGGAHPVRALSGDADGQLVMLPLDHIAPNPDQPRKHFDPAKLEELAQAIKRAGVLQPVVVMPLRSAHRDEHQYLLLAGERRWRAASRAGLTEIPAIVRDGLLDKLEIALIENLQRENLSPMEEAEAIAELKRRHHYTDQELAAVVGKSRVAVTDAVAVSRLPAAARRELSGRESKGTLVEVARSPDPVRAAKALRKGATVRELRRVKNKTRRGQPLRDLSKDGESKSAVYVGETFRLVLQWTDGKPHSAAQVRRALREASEQYGVESE
jgi:ParB family transcriptional regulator, chromosome partitioning protein